MLKNLASQKLKGLCPSCMLTGMLLIFWLSIHLKHEFQVGGGSNYVRSTV